MGITINAQENDKSEYVKSVKEMGRIVTNRSISPLKQYDFFFHLSNDYKTQKKALKILHGTTNKVINQRRNENENKGNKEVNQDEFGTKKRLAFLDLLLQAKSPDGSTLKDFEIREEVDTFMFEVDFHFIFLKTFSCI